jgi:hypothetical protein
MTWIMKLIKELIDAKYYGKLIINFQNGDIVHAVKEESLKPE